MSTVAKGLNPQDVANALTGEMRFLSRQADGCWVRSNKRPQVENFRDVLGFYFKDLFFGECLQQIVGGLEIDFPKEGLVTFEKKEQFEDGELILALYPGDKVWEPARYFDYCFVYQPEEETGDKTIGLPVDRIIKFDQDLLGTKVQDD